MSFNETIQDGFSRRAAIASGVGGVMFAGLIARLYQLQILEHEKYEGVAKENSIRTIRQPPKRGRILDRFGRPLAAHRQAGRISLIPENAEDIPALLGQLSQFVSLSEGRQKRIFDEARRLLRRKNGFQPISVINELTYEDFARISVRAPELPGLRIDMGATRSYPRGRDFAHVLGYVAKATGSDIERIVEKEDAKGTNLNKLLRHPEMRVGKSGIERFAEQWLRGEEGERRFESNAAGRIIREIESPEGAPQDGKDVVLTVDAELQKFAIDRFGTESGAAVVMDVDTGGILALVSTPAFDPNDFVNGISQKDYDVLRFNKRSPLYPKAHQGTYPPGSTFKMVVAAAAIETGVINPRERIYCNGQYRFGRNTWHCWKRGGHGPVNMHDAIKKSCDTYFYEVSKRIGIERLSETAKRFGFGHRWEIGLTGGSSGVMPNDAWKRANRGEPWFEGETLNVGIGQGQVSATPLQLAIMTAKIATEGQFSKPQLIGVGPQAETQGPDGSPVDPEILKRMKAAMYGVTSEGGGTALRSGDLGLGGPRLAGKTGTSQVRRISKQERLTGVLGGDQIARELRDHALFVAYAPHDNPQYAISVIVEHGEGGSSTAAPIARDIMAFAIRSESRGPGILAPSATAGGGL